MPQGYYDLTTIFLLLAFMALLSQSAGTYLSFEYFPLIHDFIGINSFSNFISNIFGFEYSERSARVLMMTFNPKGVEQGTAGVMNSLFIAEAWANFGVIGVILAPIYVGAFIQVIYLFFITNRKTPILIGFYAYLSYKLPVTGGINDFIYNAGLTLISVILISVYVVAYFLRYSKRILV